jgi:hypothetical protein
MDGNVKYGCHLTSIWPCCLRRAVPEARGATGTTGRSECNKKRRPTYPRRQLSYLPLRPAGRSARLDGFCHPQRDDQIAIARDTLPYFNSARVPCLERLAFGAFRPIPHAKIAVAKSDLAELLIVVNGSGDRGLSECCRCWVSALRATLIPTLVRHRAERQCCRGR